MRARWVVGVGLWRNQARRTLWTQLILRGDFTDAEVASDIQAIAGLDYPIYIFAGFRGSGDYWHDWVQDKPGFWVLDVHPCESIKSGDMMLGAGN